MFLVDMVHTALKRTLLLLLLLVPLVALLHYPQLLLLSKLPLPLLLMFLLDMENAALKLCPLPEVEHVMYVVLVPPPTQQQ